jgi:uncharacterized membrane protein
MAQTATKQRSSPVRRRSGPSAMAKNGHGPSAKNGKGTPSRIKDAVTPSTPLGVSGIARRAARKGLKKIAGKAADAGARTVRAAADRTAAAGKGALESGLSRRLPIQVSVDVAVPIYFAWDEWTSFGFFTEGVHRIEDVERDGDRLAGRTAGPRSSDWAAEILDERQQQSFAWRSVEGSDCAGLATFHRLSERLTRIELDLDVLPTTPGEALTLTLRLARRRAETELRRFKAHVEFINPDVYETDEPDQPGSTGDQQDD